MLFEDTGNKSISIIVERREDTRQRGKAREKRDEKRERDYRRRERVEGERECRGTEEITQAKVKRGEEIKTKGGKEMTEERGRNNVDYGTLHSP